MSSLPRALKAKAKYWRRKTVPYLADVNVWLALAFEKHPHCQSAWEWFNEQGSQACRMCRMTQQGFLRLSTNPKAMATPLTHLQAWEACERFLSDDRIEYSQEPPDLSSQWKRYSQNATFSPKIWNDDYLAAFAQSANMTMLTFDRGFKVYEDLEVRLLK